jgi:hypothetical protein
VSKTEVLRVVAGRGGDFAGELRVQSGRLCYACIAPQRFASFGMVRLHIEMRETDPLDKGICGQIE